jgi:DNA polymerase-3 subunit alpha
LIGFSGHPGSDLANVLFDNISLAYNANSLDKVRMLLKTDWEKQANDLAGLYQDIFGKENFFIEIQMIDRDNLPASIGISKCLRKVAKNLNIPCIGTPDSHYSFKEQASDQRVLLCSELDTTLPKVQEKLKKEEDFSLSVFFKSNNYHIPSVEEMLAVEHDPIELENAFTVSQMCDEYDIDNKPFLPNFTTNPSEKLFEEAYNGLVNKGFLENPEYISRFQKEIRVLNESGLADYFLIVQDYVKWAKNNKIPVGCSRGSAGGSLVAYLMGITELNPIPNNLIFERFYNDGRNSKDKVSLPDIDMDFSKNGRKKVIEYIKSKYGEKKVCGIVTFNKMKGRGALKAVFSAYGKITFDQMNLITSLIPEPSKISGEIQETIDEFGEASLIEYAIENEKKLKEYCYFDDNGQLQGDYAKEFEQAMRLEDTKTHMGKHAAGIIISSIDLDEICPMASDSKGTSLLCAYEMGSAEKAGLVKFDILGIAALDKLKAVNDLISTGKMERVEID